MRRAIFAAIAAAFALPACAQINGNGFLTYTPNGSNFDYNITLNNTGTTTIGTLWFSWIVGFDFMSAAPTNILAPTGWNGAVQGGFPGDGYSILWTATTLLNPGQTISGFRFTSSLTPTQMAANSPISPNLPTGTTFIYDQGPLFGQSKQFVINPVPEPITLFALTPALLLLRRRKS